MSVSQYNTTTVARLAYDQNRTQTQHMCIALKMHRTAGMDRNSEGLSRKGCKALKRKGWDMDRL